MVLTFKNIKPLIKDLSAFANVHPKALSNAMNRGNTAGRTASLKATDGGVRELWFGLPSASLKKMTYSRRASVNKHQTQFVITSRPINLRLFNATQKKKGVSYKLQRKQKQIKGSFIAKGLLLKRKGTQRDDLRAFFSITPSSMFLGVKADEIYEDAYFETFNKRYIHEIDRLLKK